MNNKIQNDHLPLKQYTLTNYYFVHHKKGKFCYFHFLSFRLENQYLKCSESVVSTNKHVLLECLVLMYFKILFNWKFKFSRKCQNKRVCVRRFLRSMCQRLRKGYVRNCLSLHCGVTEKCFSYFSTKTNVVGFQKSRLNEMVHLSTQNIC